MHFWCYAEIHALIEDMKMQPKVLKKTPKNNIWAYEAAIQFFFLFQAPLAQDTYSRYINDTYVVQSS